MATTDTPTETVILRMTGGPHEGDRFVPVDMFEDGWPFPDTLNPVEGESGKYHKVSESQLTAEDIAGDSHLMRGVQYEWRENDS